MRLCLIAKNAARRPLLLDPLLLQILILRRPITLRLQMNLLDFDARLPLQQLKRINIKGRQVRYDPSNPRLLKQLNSAIILSNLKLLMLLKRRELHDDISQVLQITLNPLRYQMLIYRDHTDSVGGPH